MVTSWYASRGAGRWGGGVIGRARSAIQQTELAHLTPPSPKQKARLLNLASTIRWMTMIAWLLKHPDATAREGISEQYLFKGAADGLRNVIGESLKHDKSTEILESIFGLYKQLERQHSKSGFTSLLACLPALLKPTTPRAVRDAFGRVWAKDVIVGQISRQ